MEQKGDIKSTTNDHDATISRLSSLFSNQSKHLLKRDTERLSIDWNNWNVEESVNDLNKLYDDILVNQSIDVPIYNSKTRNQVVNINKSSYVIQELDQEGEETKHEISVTDSISAVIDEILLQSQNNLSPSRDHSKDKHAIKNDKSGHKKSSVDNTRTDMLVRGYSNNSELEHLVSGIYRDNSKILPLEVKNDILKEFKAQWDIIYEYSIINQPEMKTIEKRKMLAQFVPYGVFTKPGGGLGKATTKYYVRNNLLFYSKFDKRLCGRVLSSTQSISSSKQLDFGSTVLILGLLKSNILVWPINEDIELKSGGNNELLSIPKEVIEPLYSEYPFGKRPYDLSNVWPKSQDLLPAKLGKSNRVVPIGLAIATKDFNTLEMETDAKNDDQVAFLTFMKDDMIIVTIKPNKDGWFEGYRARDKSCVLGLWHTKFILELFN